MLSQCLCVLVYVPFSSARWQEGGTTGDSRIVYGMDELVRVDVLFLLIAAPCVGSFIALVADQLPRDEPIVRGRSRCGVCGHTLGWLDLVPLASWLASRGKCRHCGAGIGASHPAMELGALAIAAWAVLLTPGWLAWASSALGWALLALAVIDARAGILPHQITVPLIIAGLATTAMIDLDRAGAHAIGATLGAAFVVLVRLVYRALRGREGIGLGDAMLLAVAGAWIGWQGLPSVVLIAAASGLLVATFTTRVRGRLDMRHSIAFGPYIAVATWLAWLYGPLQLVLG